MQLTERQQRIKDEYIRARGYWVEFNDGLLRYSPDFLETYSRYAGQPASAGPLPARMIELIYVAADASATHMFVDGLRLHTRLALQKGATPAEVVEVLQMATAQGLDGCTLGVGILVEELGEAGADLGWLTTPLTPGQAALKEVFVNRFGDWPEHCEQLLRLSPGYFEVVSELLAAPLATGNLTAKERALIGIALNSCLTELHADGIRLNIRRALREGATKEEILQAMQLSAHLGVHACVVGVPALMAEADARAASAAGAPAVAAQ